MPETSSLNAIRQKAADTVQEAMSGEAGTASLPTGLNQLRALIDDGIQGDESPLTERWERLGAVVSVITEEVEPGPRRDAIRAFLRQLAGDLKVMFTRADSGTPRRSKMLWWLWSVVRFDIESGSGRLYEEISQLFDEEASAGERQVLEDWLRAYLSELEETPDDGVDVRRRDTGFLLLRLLWEELDAEDRLQLAEFTDQVFPQMSALLEMGRTDEAVKLAEKLESEYLPDAVLLFGEHGAFERIEALLPEADSPELWPEVACNIAGALLEIGESRRAEPWAESAIRRRPSLDFIDFWQSHGGTNGWAAIESAVVEALGDVAPLTLLHYLVREGEFEEAAGLWASLDWFDGTEEEELFQESTARRVANLAKQSGATRLAVRIGMVCARHRLSEGGPSDLDQVWKDLVESRHLLERAGATEEKQALNREIEQLLETHSRLSEIAGEQDSPDV